MNSMTDEELRSLGVSTGDEAKGDERYSSRAVEELVQAEAVRYELRSPGLTAMLSAFVMGLGQYYNGQIRAAKVFFAGQLCLILYIYDFWAGGEVSTTVISWTSPVVYGFFMALLLGGGLLVWLFNIYDAYSTARFCEMIYDRSLPSLDEDEEEMVAAHLTTSTLGFEHHSGASRGMVFLVVAVVLYSLTVFFLGRHFSRVSYDLSLVKAQLERNPKDAFSHLQLGELLLAEGDFDGAVEQFEQTILYSDDNSWTCAAYVNLASAYRRRGGPEDEKKAREMLEKAAGLGALAQAPSPGGPRGASPGTTLSGTRTAESSSGGRNASRGSPGSGSSSFQARTADDVSGGNSGGTNAGGAKAGGSNTDGVVEVAGSRPDLAGPGAHPRAGRNVDLAFTIERAALLYQTGEYDKALACLDGFERLKGAAPQISGMRAAVYSAMKKYAKARPEFEKALAHDPSDAWALRARLAYASDKMNGAGIVAALQSYLAVRPDDNKAVCRAADGLRRLGNFDEAYALVSDQLTSYPKNKELLLRAFELARDRNEEDQAYQSALALVELGYRDIEVYRFLVGQAEKRGNLVQAVKYAQNLVVMQPGKTSWLILQGDLLRKQGDLQGAFEAYDHARVVDPADVQVYSALAATCAKQRKFDQAIRFIDKALELTPGDVHLLKDKAVVYKQSGRTALAREEIARALARDPEDLELGYLSGLYAFDAGDALHACKHLQNVYTVAPTYRDVAYFYGRVCEDLGDMEKALSAYEKVRHISPHYSDARDRAEKLKRKVDGTAASLSPTRVPLSTDAPVTGDMVPVERYAGILRDAELAFREGRLDDALALYNRVLALVPGHFRSLYQRGLILRELDSLDEAIESLKQAKMQKPGDLSVLIELGNLYADIGKYAEAEAEFEEAVRIDPKHLAARYTLGWLFEKQKNYAKAREQYKAIAWYYPEYLKAYEYLGNLAFVQGDYEEALKNYRKIIAVDTDDALVRFKVGLTLRELGESGKARQEFLFLKNTIGREHPLYAKVLSQLKEVGSHN